MNEEFKSRLSDIISDCDASLERLRDLKFQVIVRSISGLRIKDINELELRGIKDARHIALHVGTNNIPDNEMPATIALQMEKLICTIIQQNHAAYIYISSVLPRAVSKFCTSKMAPPQIKACNEKAEALNSLFKNLAARYDNCFYIGNDDTFKFGGQVNRTLLSRDGLHLSPDGVQCEQFVTDDSQAHFHPLAIQQKFGSFLQNLDGLSSILNSLKDVFDKSSTTNVSYFSIPHYPKEIILEKKDPNPNCDIRYEMVYVDGSKPWSLVLKYKNDSQWKVLSKDLIKCLNENLLKPIDGIPSVGRHVLFSERRKVFRGLVLQVISRSMRSANIKLLDIDSNAIKFVSSSKIYEVNFQAANLHSQILHCSLEGAFDSSLWPEECDNVFSQLLKECRLSITVLYKQEDDDVSQTVPFFSVKIYAWQPDENIFVNVNEWMSHHIYPALNSAEGNFCNVDFSVFDAYQYNDESVQYSDLFFEEVDNSFRGSVYDYEESIVSLADDELIARNESFDDSNRSNKNYEDDQYHQSSPKKTEDLNGSLSALFPVLETDSIISTVLNSKDECSELFGTSDLGLEVCDQFSDKVEKLCSILKEQKIEFGSSAITRNKVASLCSELALLSIERKLDEFVESHSSQESKKNTSETSMPSSETVIPSTPVSELAISSTLFSESTIASTSVLKPSSYSVNQVGESLQSTQSVQSNQFSESTQPTQPAPQSQSVSLKQSSPSTIISSTQSVQITPSVLSTESISTTQSVSIESAPQTESATPAQTPISIQSVSSNQSVPDAVISTVETTIEPIKLITPEGFSEMASSSTPENEDPNSNSENGSTIVAKEKKTVFTSASSTNQSADNSCIYAGVSPKFTTPLLPTPPNVPIYPVNNIPYSVPRIPPPPPIYRPYYPNYYPMPSNFIGQNVMEQGQNSVIPSHFQPPMSVPPLTYGNQYFNCTRNFNGKNQPSYFIPMQGSQVYNPVNITQPTAPPVQAQQSSFVNCKSNSGSKSSGANSLYSGSGRQSVNLGDPNVENSSGVKIKEIVEKEIPASESPVITELHSDSVIGLESVVLAENKNEKKKPAKKSWSASINTSEFVPRDPDALNNDSKSKWSTQDLDDKSTGLVETTEFSNSLELEHLPDVILYPKLIKLKAGSEISGTIAYFSSPDDFYAYLDDAGIYLSSLLNKMQEVYSNPKELISFESKEDAMNFLGNFGACKWKSDGYWYRVEILNWECDTDDKVDIFYLDYGNTESVNWTDLQPLKHPEFTRDEVQTVKCHFCDIKPLDSVWSEETIKIIKHIIPSSPITFKILRDFDSCESEKLGVDIFIQEENTTFSVSEKLVELKFARPISDAAVTSASPDFPDKWDPMKEDFESERNSFDVDDENVCQVISGYNPTDDTRICRFYKKEGVCWKGLYCPKEHAVVDSDKLTMDKVEVYTQAFNSLEPPPINSCFKIKCADIIALNRFYARLPDEVTCLRGDDIPHMTFTDLSNALNNKTNISCFKRSAISPALGELVIVKFDDNWYRAQVIEKEDSNNYLDVFFVDCGSTANVHIKDIRQIEPTFLHLPFQIAECTIVNIVPKADLPDSVVETGRGLLNSCLGSGNEVTIKVIGANSSQYLSLDVLVKSNEDDVGELMIANNFCDFKEIKSSKNPNLVHIPG